MWYSLWFCLWKPLPDEGLRPGLTHRTHTALKPHQNTDGETPSPVLVETEVLRTRAWFCVPMQKPPMQLLLQAIQRSTKWVNLLSLLWIRGKEETLTTQKRSLSRVSESCMASGRQAGLWGLRTEVWSVLDLTKAHLYLESCQRWAEPYTLSPWHSLMYKQCRSHQQPEQMSSDPNYDPDEEKPPTWTKSQEGSPQRKPCVLQGKWSFISWQANQ